MIGSLIEGVRLFWTRQALLATEVILVLAVATLVVASLTVALGVGAVLLRAHRARRRRAVQEEYRAWQKGLQQVLYDGAPLEVLWNVVEERQAVDFLDFLVEYARRLGGAERDRICELADPYLPRLLPRLDHRTEGVRLRAVQTLGELGLPRYTTPVVEALDDASPLVAMVAASTLAQAETPEYAREVLARLERFEHWRQDFLAAMLASMRLGAAPALRRVLADPDARARVRAVAADALAALSDPLAAEPARAALTSSDDVELRAAALRLLARVGRGVHLDAVRESLHAPELPVRLAAIRALGQFGGPDDVPILELAAKEDPSPWIALAAARALKTGGGREALEALAGSEHSRAALGLQVISEARSL